MGARVAIEFVVGVLELAVQARGEGVISSPGNDSLAGGRARWRDCCWFPDRIFGELWEVLPYRLPLLLDISDVYL